MGKRTREESSLETVSNSKKAKAKSAPTLLAKEDAVDPSLALLFASSSGPVQAPPKSRYEAAPPARARAGNGAAGEDSNVENSESEVEEGGDDEELSSVDGDLDDLSVRDLSEEISENDVEEVEALVVNPLQPSDLIERKPRKEKRKKNDDDVEGKYMQKLAKEEEKEEAERQAERRLKRQRLVAEQDPNVEGEEEIDGDANESEHSGIVISPKCSEITATPLDVPMHESLAPDKDAVELEKAARTVFLANVSTVAITDKKSKGILLDHLGSFLKDLPAPPAGKPDHKIESIRFRSTAYSNSGLPKKAAFATKSLMEATTKSTNAYVVYSTAYAAREATKCLNATIVLDRHLRVDGVAHPAKTDHRRCVFVGNLGFVDDESMMDQGGENERKRSKIPSDIEEGLWRQFGKAGAVESVRVVRDEKTRVGKGFAYVQFKDPNSVEAALLFHEKKFPPMLPRILRVTRAKAVKKTALASRGARPDQDRFNNPNRQRIYNPKITSQEQSLRGRAAKLLGRAGAAQFRKNDVASGEPKPSMAGIKTPEAIVFEGYRATSKSGNPKDLKLGGKGGGAKKGKPKGRSGARAAQWKKSGGRDAKK